MVLVIGVVYTLWTSSPNGPQATTPLFTGIGLIALGLALTFLSVRPLKRWHYPGFSVPLAVWALLWWKTGVLNTVGWARANAYLISAAATLYVSWEHGLRRMIWGQRKKDGQFSSTDQPGR